MLSRRRRPQVTALRISFAVAIIMVILSIMSETGQPRSLFEALPWWARYGSFTTAIMFGILAYMSYVMLQSVTRQVSIWQNVDDRLPWERR